ncbi:hypothetical protein LZ32DRAFT_85127 [Colletotrichum eremochloae]|nr:hypothetical protein LZ32DRAFT_85127 [Colletotrichum eremochloae]
MFKRRWVMASYKPPSIVVPVAAAQLLISLPLPLSLAAIGPHPNATRSLGRHDEGERPLGAPSSQGSQPCRRRDLSTLGMYCTASSLEMACSRDRQQHQASRQPWATEAEVPIEPPPSKSQGRRARHISHSRQTVDRTIDRDTMSAVR